MKPTLLCALLGLLLLGFALPATASLEDRVLVLPPWVEGDGARDPAKLWDILVMAYQQGVQGVEVIPPGEVLRAMEGDTLTWDLLALGEAEEWGTRLEADVVVMAEDIGGTVRVQRFDPWTGELIGPEEAGSAIVAVRRLEYHRWVFDNGLIPAPPGYAPAELEHASDALTTWLHENNEFPPEAIIQLISATVAAEVKVTSSGVPVEVRLTRVEPDGFGFEEVAAKAFWAMRYTPATLDGEAVHGMWKGTVVLSATL